MSSSCFRNAFCCISLALSSLYNVAAHSEEYGTVYFYGYLRHFQPTPTTNEGSMDLIGFSKELRYGSFLFDTGVNTYVDSFGKQSYSVFSNVSHDEYRYFGIVSPVLGLACTNKGDKYGSDSRQTYCLPVPKIRIGQRTGLFADVGMLPKVGDHTNGWASVEVGYKW